MKNVWKWLIVFGAVFLVVLIVALLFFTGSGFRRMPMMGIRGYSTINGFNVIGVFMMIFMLFIPVVLIGLAVFGVIALLQRSGNILPQPQMSACANCGKPIQVGWKVCPHCGKTIK